MLMYGPYSGKVIDIDPKHKTYLMPLPPRPVVFETALDGDVPRDADPIQTVEYGPRPLSGRIWYPTDRRDWYVGPMWDGFRPDGAPSPGDRR